MGGGALLKSLCPGHTLDQLHQNLCGQDSDIQITENNPKIHIYFCQLLLSLVYPKNIMAAKVTQLVDTLARNVLPKGRAGYVMSGPEWNENVWLCLKNYWEFQDSTREALNQARAPQDMVAHAATPVAAPEATSAAERWERREAGVSLTDRGLCCLLAHWTSLGRTCTRRLYSLWMTLCHFLIYRNQHPEKLSDLSKVTSSMTEPELNPRYPGFLSPTPHYWSPV